MKQRSIESQIVYAIRCADAHGQSKRSYMRGHGGETAEKIFSISYADEIYKTGRELAAYAADTGGPKQWAREISPLTIQGYLEHKAETCSDTTLSRVWQSIVKIERCVRARYGGQGWHLDRVERPASRVAAVDSPTHDTTVTDEQYGRILDAMRGPRCGDAWRAVILARCAGLRVREGSQIRFGRLSDTGGRYGCGILTISGDEGAKGGRWREISVLSLADRKQLQEALADRKPDEIIVQSRKGGGQLQPDSIDRAFSRAIDRAGLRDELPAGTGLHGLRKNFAQRCYDGVRPLSTRREALQFVNEQLGHGQNRRDDNDAYVARQW